MKWLKYTNPLRIAEDGLVVVSSSRNAANNNTRGPSYLEFSLNVFSSFARDSLSHGSKYYSSRCHNVGLLGDYSNRDCN